MSVAPANATRGQEPTALEWQRRTSAGAGEDHLTNEAITARLSEARGYSNVDPCVGIQLYLLACACLGLVEMIFHRPLPELHPLPPSTSIAAYLSGATLAIFALAGITGLRGAGLALAIHWALALVLTITAALKSPADALNWVPVSKTALFAIAAAVSAGSVDRRLLRPSLGLVLIFYGLIHIFFRGLIAQLIPAWIPEPAIWPYSTGALMLVAGAALVVEKAAAAMAMIVAALFASWILVLHSGRLMAHPASSFEWTFAFSALALVGVAIMTIAPSRLGERSD